MLQRSDIGTRPTASPYQRKVVHDLRNLFAVIGAGTYLLERDPPADRRKEVLAAIAEATRQGAMLTTKLLANCAGPSRPVLVDIGERLKSLAPMIRILTDARVNVAAPNPSPPQVTLVPEDFDAVILEIVSNAVAAGATTLTVRAHSCGDRIWVLIRDDGCGMSSETRARAYRGSDLGMARGTGLSRIRQFMAATGGDLRIRSQACGGTHIGLIFPASSRPLRGVLETSRTPAIPLQEDMGQGQGLCPVAA